VLRRRIQTQAAPPPGSGRGSVLLRTARDVARREGWRALFAGIVPT